MNDSNVKMHSILSVKEYLKVCNDLNLNLGLCAAHGRGKTFTIKEYAQEAGFELITLILSRFLPEDLLGLPIVKEFDGEKITSYSNPEWLVKACDPNRKVLLFFDEFNNAELDVQSAILNLIEDRELGDMKLADSTQIVICFNPSSIAPNSRILSKATRDRLCIVPLFDDHKSGSEYYSSNDMPELVYVLADMPETINNYNEETMEAAYENAEFTYRSLEKAYKICKYVYENNLDYNIAKELVCGYGGKSGMELANYLLKEFSRNKDSNSNMSEYLSNSKYSIEEKIDFIKKNELINTSSSFDKVRSSINRIKNYLTPEEFDVVLNKLFTKEFQELYSASEVI